MSLKRSENPKRLTGQRNQCSACLEYFSTNSGFDKHRVGEHGVNRRCLNVEEITAKGMRKDETGFWKLPIDPRMAARIAKFREGVSPRIDDRVSDGTRVSTGSI